MSLNESSRKTRDRWPLAFDLEGVPRETAERERRLLQQQILETTPEAPEMNAKPVPNSFAVDYQEGGTVIDINNPPKPKYQHQEYPKLVYPANWPKERAIAVASREEEAEKLRKKFTLKPPVKKEEEPAG